MSSRKRTCAWCGLKGARKKDGREYYHKDCWKEMKKVE